MDTQLPPPQVHQKKGDVVQDIDARDVVVEFDAVEERGHAAQQADVSQMQVAVAFAHQPSASPTVQPCGMRNEGRLRVRREARADSGVKDPATLLDKADRVAVGDPGDPGASSVIASDSRVGMQMRDRQGEVAHQRQVQPIGRSQPIEQRALIESPHLDEPVDGRALAVERERAVSLARNGTNTHVQPWCGPAIEAHLRFARHASQCHRGEIDVVEAHGSF